MTQWNGTVRCALYQSHVLSDCHSSIAFACYVLVRSCCITEAARLHHSVKHLAKALVGLVREAHLLCYDPLMLTGVLLLCADTNACVGKQVHCLLWQWHSQLLEQEGPADLCDMRELHWHGCVKCLWLRLLM